MSTTKCHVAVELLEWAIRAFLSGNGYYSAIHLAGAAEEIFAVYLRSPTYNKTPSADELKKLVVHLSSPQSPREEIDISKWVIDRLNSARNSVKHKKGHGDEYVDFDAKIEAGDAIRRAICNYSQLSSATPLPPVHTISDFYLAIQQQTPQET